MGTWTPAESLLATVKEFQSFSSTITYFEPGDGATIPDTYYPVTITQVSPQATITTTNGINATISGYVKYVFYDTIVYLDFNNTLKTLTGSETQGTWEQFDINDCYQLVEFTPDDQRYRRLEFIAEAKNGATVIATNSFYVDVSDRSWTPGLNALKNVVQVIRSRGN